MVVTYQYAYQVPGLPARVDLCPGHGAGDRDPASGRPLGPVEHGLHRAPCDACDSVGVHVTRVTVSGVYGHSSTRCDEGGCAAGTELYYAYLDPCRVTLGKVTA